MTALLNKEEFIAKKRDELKRATIVLMFKSTYACNAKSFLKKVREEHLYFIP